MFRCMVRPYPVQQTPAWWDRDCRCCMTNRQPEDLFGLRQIKGIVDVIVVMSEEIHAWHTPEQIETFVAYEEARRV